LKAELFSSDFIIGLSIFLIAMGVFGLYYESLQGDVADYKIRNEIQNKAINIADLLVTSSGDPQYWNSANVNVIGLYDDGLINLTKFEELKNIEHYTAKRMLGLGGYEIYIEIRNETAPFGYALQNNSVTYSFGNKSNENSLQVFYVERYGLAKIDGNVTKVKIGVVVWS
jgi:hypothetical protein